MDRSKRNTRVQQDRTGAAVVGTVLALSVAACSGSGLTSNTDGNALGGNMPDPTMMPTGTAGNGGAGVTTNPPTVDGMAVAGDPGAVGLHRLSNTEYNNTVADLLGNVSAPAAGFLAEEALGFDNIASAFGMTPAQFEAYYGVAEALATAAFADPVQRARIMTCEPAVADDPCALQIVQNFGLRAFRAPLSTEQVARAMAVYNAELARSTDASAAMQLTVRAILTSANFLYRVEVPAAPTSTAPQALSSYEIASRLSYMHWSTMPDQTLFDLAASGALLDRAQLEAQVDRMLADARGETLVRSFGGQWLDINELTSHTVVPQIFPTWNADLQQAMMTEGVLWLQEFVDQDRPLTEWFTADFNYVNDALATHYGMTPPGTGAEFARVEVLDDERSGFLGLAHILTSTSFPSRTSPTLRGVWVLSELLCSEPPPPPPTVPNLDDAVQDEPLPDAQNVRERLELHRSAPACAGCHAALDPIGLAMEGFDGIGRHRTAYENGDAIDATGALPTGQSFNGLIELQQVIATDARFSHCVAEKLFTYSLGRGPTETDAAYLEQIQTNWEARGVNIRNLLKEIVTNDTFRFTRGEAAPPAL